MNCTINQQCGAKRFEKIKKIVRLFVKVACEKNNGRLNMTMYPYKLYKVTKPAAMPLVGKSL